MLTIESVITCTKPKPVTMIETFYYIIIAVVIVAVLLLREYVSDL